MTPRSPFGWSENAARFYDRRTGRFVSRDTIRLALDDVIDMASTEARAISESLRAGKITLADWQRGMRDLVKTTMLDAEALAHGGRGQLTQADYGRVGAAIREQYRYLDGFTEDIRNGLPLDGRFLNRAVMYSRAARPFFHDEQTDLLAESGYTEEMSILHAAEHCVECVDQNAIGWAPIGTLIPIGERQCLANDVCTMRYR